MKKSTSKLAFEEFISGNYNRALELYEELKQELGSNAFDYNIKKCREKLALNAKAAVPKTGQGTAIPQKLTKTRKSDGTGDNPKICYVRIIGNDLPGLHSDTQAIENLKFVLDNEP